MAATTTTASSAIAVDDQVINFTSLTGLVNGMWVKADDEWFIVNAPPNVALANPVQVTRGQNGSAQATHASGCNLTFGVGSDFGNPNSAVITPYSLAGRRRKIASYTAAGAISLPTAGEDLFVILNGTSTLAMTIAAPTKDMDGSHMVIVGNGVAAHTIQFTGGLSGAGASYDIITVNSSAPIGVSAYAVNGLWIAPIAPAMTGTVTNITGGVA